MPTLNPLDDMMKVDGTNERSGRGKQIEKYATRLAFSKFVNTLAKGSVDGRRLCCGEQLTKGAELDRHVNMHHLQDIQATAQTLLLDGCNDAKWAVLRPNKHKDDDGFISQDNEGLPVELREDDVYPWLPRVSAIDKDGTPGQILLFYKYRELKNTEHVRRWQEVLCQRLCLTGKVRVAPEGLNGTVGGCTAATLQYMNAVMKHPWFNDMTPENFKTSLGCAGDFAVGLCIGVYAEAVPMGIDPHLISYKDAGVHLSPEEFHQAVSALLTGDKQDDAVLIDCRNFYESKIGSFKGAVVPDIRKFSYWPEYVDENAHLFKNKDVYMYCTGGIRCERGSAYLKNKGICKEVYQLEGGIHKYIEKYPDGYFRGKLFVFDDRYAIKANSEVLSVCVYCTAPWDAYEACSSSHCHQLVLSCPDCRLRGLTTCCATCQQNNNEQHPLEQCDCTQKRGRPISRTQTDLHTAGSSST